jgi:hypothetical protein
MTNARFYVIDSFPVNSPHQAYLVNVLSLQTYFEKKKLGIEEKSQMKLEKPSIKLETPFKIS